MEFHSKEEITSTVKRLYCDFYERKKENHIKGEAFSEQKFAQSINVPQPILNNLRHGGRKELSMEVSTKILKGIEKEEYIDPISKFLMPETHRNLFTQNNFTKDFNYKEERRINDISYFIKSEKFGPILALVSTGYTTVRHIKNKTTEAEFFLDELVAEKIVVITKKREIKFTNEFMKLANEDKLDSSFPGIVDYNLMLAAQMNPVLVKKNKEAGYAATVVQRIPKSILPQAFAHC